MNQASHQKTAFNNHACIFEHYPHTKYWKSPYRPFKPPKNKRTDIHREWQTNWSGRHFPWRKKKRGGKPVVLIWKKGEKRGDRFIKRRQLERQEREDKSRRNFSTISRIDPCLSSPDSMICVSWPESQKNQSMWGWFSSKLSKRCISRLGSFF